ncbi:PRC-barrel domain containing protein [Catellatospora sp. KI3]|uniref:PRC-barrel domain containing protein n=1 Tax=Catellatospora sp. KI3 TaxID=3041620 RepID=UPI0024829AD6|nr:PRC-barrel domain containing protein [Catellatospora sp. KI3]MDI1462145.1 PRC-barrel domain containing protein [Catellatospora sp. KI3]
MNPVPWDPWNYRETLDYKPADDGGDRSIVGFHVEATDGGIGKIDEATGAVGSRYLVVDTGPWIFGSKVLLPAGVITNIDFAEERVYVDRSKAEIKDAPEYDPDRRDDADYRGSLGDYYAGGMPR